LQVCGVTMQILLNVGLILLLVGTAFVVTGGVMLLLKQEKRDISKVVDPEDIHVDFDDVKGCDEAKNELQEIVEYLINPVT
jgi:ATP-dependent metalloprotease